MKMLFNRSFETLEYLSFCGNLRKLNHDVIIDKVQTLNAIEIPDTFVYFYTTNFFDSLTVLNQENIRGGKKSISAKLTNQIKGLRTNLLFRNRILSLRKQTSTYKDQ